MRPLEADQALSLKIYGGKIEVETEVKLQAFSAKYGVSKSRIFRAALKSYMSQYE